MSKYTALFTEFFPTIKGAVLKITSTVHTALGRSSGEHVCWHNRRSLVFPLSWKPAPGVPVPGRHRRRGIWGSLKMTRQQSRDLARWDHWWFQKRQRWHLVPWNGSSWSWLQVFPAGTRQVVLALLSWQGLYFRKNCTWPWMGPQLCVPAPITVYLLSVPVSMRIVPAWVYLS